MSKVVHNLPSSSRRAGGGSKLVNLDLEAQIIGAVLFDNGLFKDCAALEAAHFNDQTHQALWTAIVAMIEDSRKVTAATLAVDLDPGLLDSIGGRNHLASLALQGEQIAPTISKAAEYLRSHATWRQISALSEDMKRWVQSDGMTADEALSAIVKQAELAIQSGRPTSRTKIDVARAALTEILQPRDLVTTGIDSLDFLMQGGLIPSRLYGLLGLFGRGKTIMLGTISENLNAQGEKHLVISLETRPEDMEIRNAARRLKMNASQLFDTDDPDHQRFVVNAERYIDQIPDHTIYEYMPGATVDDIHRAIIRSSHRYGIKGFILDYWQLVTGKEKGQSQSGHLSAVANRLSAITKRENLWGMMAAQADVNGQPLDCPYGLQQATNLCVRLVRDENDTVGHFETVKSNYSRYADTGNASVPGMLFDLAGPHFRNLDAEDYSRLQHESLTGDQLNLSD